MTHVATQQHDDEVYQAALNLCRDRYDETGVSAWKHRFAGVNHAMECGESLTTITGFEVVRSDGTVVFRGANGRRILRRTVDGDNIVMDTQSVDVDDLSEDMYEQKTKLIDTDGNQKATTGVNDADTLSTETDDDSFDSVEDAQAAYVDGEIDEAELREHVDSLLDESDLEIDWDDIESNSDPSETGLSLGTAPLYDFVSGDSEFRPTETHYVIITIVSVIVATVFALVDTPILTIIFLLVAYASNHLSIEET